MKAGIVVTAAPQDRIRLEAIVDNRNTQKHAARARVIIATADGCGTTEIMRRSGLSKPVVWRWQERVMREGVDGLQLRHPKAPQGVCLARPPSPLDLPLQPHKRNAFHGAWDYTVHPAATPIRAIDSV